LGFQTLIRQANKDFYGNPSMFDYVPVQKKQSEPKRVSRAIAILTFIVNIVRVVSVNIVRVFFIFFSF
jgi:hypothetical protein